MQIIKLTVYWLKKPEVFLQKVIEQFFKNSYT